MSKLHNRVREQFVKNQGDVNNDIMKVKTLLYAFLLREPVPPSLQADMQFVLSASHRRRRLVICPQSMNRIRALRTGCSMLIIAHDLVNVDQRR